MSTLKTPFRYDFVGSFLRPQKLKDAKADFAAGKITQDELEKITDDCVRDIVAAESSRLSCYNRWRISQKVLAS